MNSPSFLDLKTISLSQVEKLFSLAAEIKSDWQNRPVSEIFTGRIASLVFFESSTRTRCSFETALVREGYYPLFFDGGAKTSLEKGETLEDTLRNLNTYEPDFFIIRCGDNLDLQKMNSTLNRPILNAGWGVKGHPTQALLDIFTLVEESGPVQKKKIVFVGDVRSSRVFSSHLELSKVMNYEVGIYAPDELMSNCEGISNFRTLKEALTWGDHFVFLRMQKERHDADLTFQDYLQEFGASKNFLSQLGSGQFFLHPGPVNYGVEIEESVTSDSRCLIMKQAGNGVFIRRALIRDLKRGVS